MFSQKAHPSWPLPPLGDTAPTCLLLLGEVRAGKHRAGTSGAPFLEITQTLQ